MASVDSIEVLDQPSVRGVPKRVKNGVFRDFSSKMSKSVRSIFEILEILDLGSQNLMKFS